MTNQPIVHIKDNQVFANSRDVAVYFGKRHADVLRDLDRILEQSKPTDAHLRWFIATPYRDAKGEMRRSCDMTKDGFTLLVMGYTGVRAMEFKLKYIEQFNLMEAELRNQQPQLPDFTNPAEAARAFAEQYEQKQLAEQKALEYKEWAEMNEAKAEKFEGLMDAEGSLNSTVVAEILSARWKEVWTAQRLHKVLKELGIIKQMLSKSRKSLGWNIRSKYADKGWHYTITNEYNGIVRHQLRWTPRGVDAIVDLVDNFKMINKEEAA